MKMQLKKVRVLALVTSALAALAGTGALAQDAGPVRMTGDITWTAVSGYSGGYYELGTSGNTRLATKITWWEMNDFPCKFTLNSRDLNTRGAGRDYSNTFRGCSSPGNRKYVRTANIADSIYKVQVCTTDRKKSENNRLKGIRIWTQTANDNLIANTTRNATPIESRHTNCKKWRRAVSCPAGQAAAKIRVTTGAKAFYGIALGCRRLVQ